MCSLYFFLDCEKKQINEYIFFMFLLRGILVLDEQLFNTGKKKKKKKKNPSQPSESNRHGKEEPLLLSPLSDILHNELLSFFYTTNLQEIESPW